MDFVLNKNSLIVSVSPEMTIAQYEENLLKEGLTGFYYPIKGIQKTWGECLEKRIPNIYDLKYGGPEELCVGGTFLSHDNRLIKMKDAPRSATGSDLRRVLIGSKKLWGEFKTVSLKVYPQPEKQLWGIWLFESHEKVLESMSQLFGNFICPLFAKIMTDQSAHGLLRSMNINRKSDHVVVFKLSGLKRIVLAEKEAMLKMNKGDNVFFYWPVSYMETNLLTNTLLNGDSAQDRFTWPMYQSKSDLEGCEGFKPYFEENIF